MEAKTEISNCADHQVHLAEFVCLDPNCTFGAKACVLCIKNVHLKCSESFFVSLEELSSCRRGLIQNKDALKQISEIFDRKTYQLFLDIKTLQQQVLSNVEKAFPSPENNSFDLLLAEKSRYDISYVPETKKIIAKPKYLNSEEDISELVGKFTFMLDKEIEKFLKAASSISFNTVHINNPSSWKRQSSISVSKENGIMFTKEETGDDKHYIVFLKSIKSTPLLITIENAPSKSQPLEFGLVNETQLNTLENANMAQNESIGISFSGSSVNLMKGTYLKKGELVGSGFENGVTYRIEQKEKAFFITCPEKEVALEGVLGDKHTYNFFIALIQPKASVSIKVEGKD